VKQNHRWNLINNYFNNEKSVFLLGGGTSLSGFDLSKLDKEFVIAINHSIEVYPQAQALLFGDKIFLHKTTFDLDSYEGMIFCSEKTITSKPLQDIYPKENIFAFEDRRDEPLMNAKMGLFHPSSSGILTLNLALQMKAKKIYLLGYDYYKDKNNNMHFYEDYDHHRKYEEEKLVRKIHKYPYFERWKSKIYNLNPDSLIPTFQKLRLKDVFK
jgi:hypothetical protein